MSRSNREERDRVSHRDRSIRSGTFPAHEPIKRKTHRDRVRDNAIRTRRAPLEPKEYRELPEVPENVEV